MMHTPFDQEEWLLHRTQTRRGRWRVRRGRSPWVGLPVDNRQSGIRNVEPAVLVDDLDVRRGGYVECIAADDAEVLEVDGAGDQGHDVLWHAAAGLEESPSVEPELVFHVLFFPCDGGLGGNVLCAVLIRPAPPLLADIVLRVKRRVVRCEASVLALPAANTGCHGGDINVSDEIEQGFREVRQLPATAVPSGCDQAADCRFLRSGVRVQEREGRDVATVVREGWTVHSWIPVTALPVTEGAGEDTGKIIVVGEIAEAEDILVLVNESRVAVLGFR